VPRADVARHAAASVAVPPIGRVAFLGPRGTFSDEALMGEPDLAVAEHVPVRQIADVFLAVERGEADLGLAPIENSIEGSVTVTVDILGFESDLLVQREIVHPVSLGLCAKPGTRLADVRRVASIPVAAAQCRRWLAANLPEAALEAANSTAEAVEAVARSKRPGGAAVGNRLAAELYGLERLADEIEDHPGNRTRFVLVGRGVPAPTGHDKTSIVCFQDFDRPGSLLTILQEFAARSINLTRLESRPTKQGLGDYCFFIDAEGHVADELLADALKNLVSKQVRVKFLGSYPAGGDGGVDRRRAAGKRWRDAARWLDELRGQIRAPGDDPHADAVAP
jgi:prephenate dehydratase